MLFKKCWLQQYNHNKLFYSRSRFSNKCRADSSPTCLTSCKECVYADPCIGAPPSFHQRLNELSLLEAETIKYEKSRKFKRKPKSDKDSWRRYCLYFDKKLYFKCSNFFATIFIFLYGLALHWQRVQNLL